MIEAWKEFTVIFSPHSLIKLDLRGIAREEIEAHFKQTGKLMFCKASKTSGRWEVFFKRSHKYCLKVVVAPSEAGKQLIIVTAHVIDKKRAQKAKLWLK